MDVRVHQHQGETHVVVRAAEETTRLALRQDLPHLVTALDRAGFRAETLTPRELGDAATTARAVSGDEPLTDTVFRDSSRDAGSESGKQHTEGSPGGSEPEHRQHRQREHMHDYWLDQMEE